MRLIMHSSMLIIAVLQLAVIHPTASTGTSTVLAPHEISYLVLSQSSAFYARRALALRQSILEQQAKLAKFNDQPVPPELGTHSSSDNVHLSHELFADHEGSWAITPILKHIRASILKASHAGTRWLIICEENSQVNVSLLAHHLSKEDYRQEPVASGAPHILFAVKTCAKFHEERVPVLLHTWAQYVRHLRLYSDTGDVSIPTIATSIPNTSIGHCAKTLEILHLINEEIFHNSSLADVRWIMLVDDDTILSPSALVRHLSCFDFNKDVYLGERYGYHLLTTRGDGTAESGYGYNYITGGGGIVISVTILDALLRSCECPSASSPDDMIIAACLYRLGVRPVHSPLFHQARPSDYPPEILGPDSISFHKHWQIDPYHVYNRWFRLNDELWYRQNTDRVTIENTVNNKPLLHPNHICNENDSTRQPFNRLSHAIGNVAAPAHDKHSNQQPPSDGKHSATTATTSMANRYQTEHIGNPFCESNELQSNSNLLLNRHHEVSSHSLQQPNIIKHTEL
ncbi:uncharacterized protein LOC128741695 isoform X2 [Sabethes cyaneus]|uniref:uncharacterized protein LOC128741695 isoform X2 n=1 Tax=Sabethes cyaneus TaxID=53552 RepID=UPI00237EBF05|nr:uncharacterized protein LOC128741695 isoform X2 [Sabethes cyaneus]